MYQLAQGIVYQKADFLCMVVHTVFFCCVERCCIFAWFKSNRRLFSASTYRNDLTFNIWSCGKVLELGIWGQGEMWTRILIIIIIILLVGNSCATGVLLQWPKRRIWAQGTKGRRKSWSKAMCTPWIPWASSWLAESVLPVLPRASRRASRDQTSERLVFYQDTR